MTAKHQHFKLYKPDGYISQFITNQKRGHKKRLLGEFYNFPKEIMAIGRLDEPSEGLLLLTTDGKLSNYINSSAIEKEYFAQVDGIISEKEIAVLKSGVKISHRGKKYLTQPCQAKIIAKPNLPKRQKNIRGDHHGPTSWISITLKEGRYRQVRKMTAVVGFPTLRLVRIRIGNLSLENMQPGEVGILENLDNIEESLNRKFI